MQQGLVDDFEAILGCLSVGIIVLDSAELRIRYLNSYLHKQFEQYLLTSNAIGKPVAEFLPEQARENVLTRLRSITTLENIIEYTEIPYEGLLYIRGKTYWHVTIKKTLIEGQDALLILVEDVTEKVRFRLQIKAIQAISSAIAGTYALPLVLDRIMDSLHELVGATHCAVLLIEQSGTGYDEPNTAPIRRATFAAQRGVSTAFWDWRPILNEHLLLGRVEQEHSTLIISDTSTVSDIDLPSLDDPAGFRPRSVLCVPMYESYTLEENTVTLVTTSTQTVSKKTVIGSIEVYSRQARTFAQEEVALLEQFAQQGSLAIQNTRLLSTTSRLARAERRSANQQKYVMQAIPDGVIIFDPRWRVAETNSAIRTLLGWNENILGQTIQQALGRSKATLHYDIIGLADPIPELERRAHSGLIDEFKIIGADGRAYTTRCTYTPIRDDLGDTFAFVVIFHDVTEQTAVRERIEAEVIQRTKELAQRNEELKALEQAREDFFTTIAHELKTPLANIRASLSALLASDLRWSREEQYASLQIADEQAKWLERMVNHVLNASRIEAGALRLDLEAVLLPELFEDLEERMKALIRSSKRHLRIKCRNTLPAVRADYERIISVLTNLLSNAFRFAPEGDTVLLEAEPLYDVRSNERTHPIGVRIQVSDTGPGITQERQKQLFTRFSTFSALKEQEPETAGREQRQASSRWSSTTGLGLYISRGIVEAHGSTLTLESEPGQGARFSFTLPTYEAAQHQIDEK